MSVSNFDEFKLYFPGFAKDAVSWKSQPNGDLVVKLNDGTRWYYTTLIQAIRKLPNDPNNLTEQECKKEFGIRLKKKMLRSGVTQGELSTRTNLSQKQISEYITGKRSPSFYVADKIAKAIGCTIDDFRYVEFEEEDY